jgi:hypothetical protein
MGNLFTERMGNILTTLMGNVLTAMMGKVLDIYIPHLLHSESGSPGVLLVNQTHQEIVI